MVGISSRDDLIGKRKKEMVQGRERRKGGMRRREEVEEEIDR